MSTNFVGSNGIVQGAAWEFTATFTEAGVAKNIAGYTIEFELKKNERDTVPFASMTTGVDARIVIVGDGSTGQASYSLPVAVTDLIDRKLHYQQYTTAPGGSRLPAGSGTVDVRAWGQ